MNETNKVITLGCRLNTFESEIIKNQINNSGIKNTIIVNTCCVTQKAENESISYIKKLKKIHPEKNIVATGCAVFTALDKLSKMKEVHKIIDNYNKFSVSALNNNEKIILNNSSNKKHINTETKYEIPILVGFENRTRAFIQIQQGCDHRCSFCIIHKARGSSISLSKEDIIEQIKKLVDYGHKEIILTGVDISSWNRNIFSNEKSRLGELCLDILKEVKNLERLRLSSLDPAVIDENILTLLSNEERFMPHLHLSLQSMSNPVLNNMGRRHSKESAVSWIHSLLETNPNLVIGADIICGFPKETEEQFIETFNCLKELNIPLLHVFPYSERTGTPAAKMEQLDMKIRKRRALSLIALAKDIEQDFLAKKIHSTEEVLVENNNIGHTKDFSLVKIINKEVPKNSIVTVIIKNVTPQYLIGEIVNV